MWTRKSLKRRFSKKMMTLRDFLQFGRAGSWPIVLLAVVIPYLINQPLFTWYTLWLFVLTFLLQTSTLMHNAVMDYPWDKKDPSKQHHPLVAGRVDYDSAVQFAGWYLLLVSVLAIITCLIFPGGNKLLSLMFIFCASIFGHAYNDMGFSKFVMTWPTITGYAVSLAGFGYFLGTNEHFSISGIILPILFYGMFREIFQVSVSGRIKDMKTDEGNELKLIGARLENGFFYPGFSWIYAVCLTIGESLVGIYMFLNFCFSWYTLPIIIIFFCIGWILVCRAIKPREYKHEHEVVFLSLNEVVWIFLLSIILSPLIGFATVAFMLIFALTWFFIANKFIWNVPYTKF